VLNELLRERVKRVYTIGAAAPIIEEDIQGTVDVVRAGTLENAIRRAAENAVSGDIVLLAPACSSFDQFQSYEQRGDVFKSTVKALAARQTATRQLPFSGTTRLVPKNAARTWGTIPQFVCFRLRAKS
jgi:UDP-N-acetylmuramoylalanine--D-glutamate ligase